MKLIQGKPASRPARKKADYIRKVGEIVDAVNAGLPGDGYHNWFENDPAAKAAIHIKDGAYQPQDSATDALRGGAVTDGAAGDVRVVAYDGRTGGIFVEGAGRFEAERVTVSVSGNATGIGGPACGAAVKNGGELVLRDACIDASGFTHYATAAERGSILRVYDSVLSSHGGPFGDGQPQPAGIMQTPPPGLMIDGNGRTHCTMTRSQSYFDRCLITCDGWGALSTETAEGYAYLEANDCRVVTVRRGYGAYADPGCHVALNRCEIDSADMAGIIGGEGEMRFTDCDALCGSCFVLCHSVAGVPEEVGEVKVTGGRVRSAGPVALIRSDNADLLFERADLCSEQDVLIHTQVNDDPVATPVGEDPYGVEVTFRAMRANGDVLHEDTERPLYLSLESADLRGAVQNARLGLDQASLWFATADSRAVLTGEAELRQFDAPEGVTITLYAVEDGRFELPSGGTLILTTIQEEFK